MSYEKSEIEKMKRGEHMTPRLDFSTFKYLWQSSPLSLQKKSIPKFLREIPIFKNFSDNELRILSKFFHLRSFGVDEKVFIQGDPGVGFYLLYSGEVDIFVTDIAADDKKDDPELDYILTLEQGDFFGELGLLQNNSIRSATVNTRVPTELLGIFKPDLEELITHYPNVGSRLLQSLSSIVTQRLFSLTNEIKKLKIKLVNCEK